MRRRDFALLALATPAVARAQAAERWDLPTGFIDSNFHTQTLRGFCEDVAQRSGGKLDIRLHPNNSLLAFAGIRRAVQQGQVQAGESLLSLHGNEDPILEADAIPYLAVGYDQAMTLYRAQRPFVDARFAQIGLRLLYAVPWPGQGLYTKAPVTTLADLRGMRMRTPTPASTRLAELIGAVPTMVQSGEVAQAFATNVVTGMMTSAPTGIDTQAWEFARYFYTADSWHPKNGVMVNARAFDRLDPAVKTAVLEAAAAAELRGWAASQASDVAAKQRLVAQGMQVLPVPPALDAEFKAASRQIAATWAARAGEPGATVIRAMGG
ncbi:TRAP transporter substrate-binding protein [Humitalea sp. 24SJ18S-53]|uniref:TRAP transporter substrate-binding protein n=1 Tax=Humitalea sp. 24SJ18S-53 TaxID=3422307 RepID=UPI003D665A0F